jgi:hypothetical protein
MAMVIKRQTKACVLFTLAWLAITVLGCGAWQSRQGFKSVPVSSFDAIAGKWEGLSKAVPEMRDDAQVILIIREQGRFNFVSDRGTGLILGTGNLTILDGRVLAKSDHGTGTFTLHEKAGTPLLVVEVSLNDGHHYYLEMTRLTE